MRKKLTFLLCLMLTGNASLAAEEYFYCGYSNLDGSAQDYAKFGKGTDFKFNKSNNRWEWNTKYTYQYIYPNGQYEQIARVGIFDNQNGLKWRPFTNENVQKQ